MTATYEPDYDLGWCHHCMTFQRIEDAPILQWHIAARGHCCVFCRNNEPWEFGVWDATQFVEQGTYSMAELIERCSRQACCYPGDDKSESRRARRRRLAAARRAA